MLRNDSTAVNLSVKGEKKNPPWLARRSQGGRHVGGGPELSLGRGAGIFWQADVIHGREKGLEA